MLLDYITDNCISEINGEDVKNQEMSDNMGVKIKAANNVVVSKLKKSTEKFLKKLDVIKSISFSFLIDWNMERSELINLILFEVQDLGIAKSVFSHSLLRSAVGVPRYIIIIF